jgi:hypothetical protein
LVEDRHPERGQPAVDRHPALDPTLDWHAAVNATGDGGATLDQTLNRVAPVHPTLDGIETFDGQPTFEWLHALDELAQPRLFRASARQHAVAPRPVDVESTLWWGRAEEIGRRVDNNQKVPSMTGPFSLWNIRNLPQVE